MKGVYFQVLHRIILNDLCMLTVQYIQADFQKNRSMVGRKK